MNTELRTKRSFALLVLVIGGCGPHVSLEDLGTLEFRIPAVPGTEQPYPLPQLDQPPAELPADAPPKELAGK